MTLETTQWDVTEHLDCEEAIAQYIEAALEDGDPRLVAAALGDVARALGMTQIAREAGVTREALYHSLNENGDPRLSTVMGVLKALRIKLSAQPSSDARSHNPQI